MIVNQAGARIDAMAGKRTYGDRCGIARALEIVGERWALLVVRELLLGPKRFTDLRAGLPKIGPDVLAQRLRELEESGVVRRGQLPLPAASRVYELTPRGLELEPVVLALGRWGSRAPFPEDATAFDPDSVMLALKTLYAPPAAASLLGRLFELGFGDQRFWISPMADRLEVQRGAAPAPAATVETDPATLARLLWHGGELTEEQRAGRVRVSGSAPSFRRLLRAFPLPA